jgi:nitrite reductase/ring-hydroxylating ferredoxin subunit
MTDQSTVASAGLSVLCTIAEVAEDAPLKVSRDERDYAVFKVADRIYVTQDACTHGPGSLSEGFVENGEVECPFHQGRFELATGRPSAPPCTEALRIWTVHLSDGRVLIDPNEEVRAP